MIVFDHLMEGILSDLADSVYAAKLDGPGNRPLPGSQGNPSGIAFAEMPHKKLKTFNRRHHYVPDTGRQVIRQ